MKFDFLMFLFLFCFTHSYINFVLSYEMSLKNSLFVGYASSNGEVLETLSGYEGDYEGNEAYLPRVGYDKDEIFRYNEHVKKMISDLWTKRKKKKKVNMNE